MRQPSSKHEVRTLRRAARSGSVWAWATSCVLHGSVLAMALRLDVPAVLAGGDGRAAGGGGEIVFELTIRPGRAGARARSTAMHAGDPAPLGIVAPLVLPHEIPPQPPAEPTLSALELSRVVAAAWAPSQSAPRTKSTDPGVGGSRDDALVAAVSALPMSAQPLKASESGTPPLPTESPIAASPHGSASGALAGSVGGASQGASGGDGASNGDSDSSGARSGGSGSGGPGFGGRAGLVLLSGPRPEYPPLSVRYNEEGLVACELTIRADGRVARVDVVASSGFRRLDDAAVESLRKWRFRAPVPGADADGLRVAHRVTFRLE